MQVQHYGERCRQLFVTHLLRQREKRDPVIEVGPRSAVVTWDYMEAAERLAAYRVAQQTGIGPILLLPSRAPQDDRANPSPRPSPGYSRELLQSLEKRTPTAAGGMHKFHENFPPQEGVGCRPGNS